MAIASWWARAALGWVVLSGCVAYRERLVTVGTRTEVALCGRAQGDSVAWPETPRRLNSVLIGRLAGYGQWHEDRALGPVWTPDAAAVGAGFTPYVSRGQWVLSDAGWFWQSDDPWGAVTFHYGRWVVREGQWRWVPGTAFAPAWVDWRVGGGWVGWAPLGPVGLRQGSRFVFCGVGRLGGPGLAGRVVGGDAGVSLFPRTEGLDPAPGHGGTRYGWGPAPREAGAGDAPVTPLGQAWSVALASGSSTPAQSQTPREGRPEGAEQEGARGVPAGSRGAQMPSVALFNEIPSVRAGFAAADEGDAGDGDAGDGEADAPRVVGPYHRPSISLGTTYETASAGNVHSVNIGAGAVATREVRALPPPAAMPGGYGVLGGVRFARGPVGAVGGTGPIGGATPVWTPGVPTQRTPGAAPSTVLGTSFGGVASTTRSAPAAMAAPTTAPAAMMPSVPAVMPPAASMPVMGPDFNVR